MDVSYVPCCPNCGHLLITPSRIRHRNKRFLSFSCPRLPNLLKRKKHVRNHANEEDEEPIICKGCESRVTRMYKEQHLCVNQLLSQKGRKSHTSLFKNLMQVLYGAPFKDYKDFFDVISSNDHMTDLESEQFVSSTEYAAKNIEDNLKEKLLEECLKSERQDRMRPNKLPRLKDSQENLRTLFLNQLRDNSLQRSSTRFSTVSIETKLQMTPSETTVTQTCYDGSWKHGLIKTCPNQSRVIKNNYYNGNVTANQNLMDKNSTFTKSKSKLGYQKYMCKQSHMETQYSLSLLKPYKKKKKRKSHSEIKKKYMGDMQEQNLCESWKELRFDPNKASRRNWVLVKKPKTLKETGVSTKLDDFMPIFENNRTFLPPESMRRQVMYINPSRIFVNSLVITRENIDTQCDIIAEPKPVTPVSCKCEPKYFCEKACQYSVQKITVPSLRFRTVNQVEQRMIFQCDHRQASKVIQSPCNHNPPCELVPSCFQAKPKVARFIVNYCRETYLDTNCGKNVLSET